MAAPAPFPLLLVLPMYPNRHIMFTQRPVPTTAPGDTIDKRGQAPVLVPQTLYQEHDRLLYNQWVFQITDEAVNDAEIVYAFAGPITTVERDSIAAALGPCFWGNHDSITKWSSFKDVPRQQRTKLASRSYAHHRAAVVAAAGPVLLVAAAAASVGSVNAGSGPVASASAVTLPLPAAAAAAVADDEDEEEDQ